MTTYRQQSFHSSRINTLKRLYLGLQLEFGSLEIPLITRNILKRSLHLGFHYQGLQLMEILTISES